MASIQAGGEGADNPHQLWHMVNTQPIIFIIIHLGQYSVSKNENENDRRREWITVSLTVCPMTSPTPGS